MKKIPKLEDYFITKRGVVYSNKSGVLKPLKPRLSDRGRLRVELYVDICEPKWFSVSRLVALTYIPNPNNYPMVLHKDDNPFNNDYKNLMWGTHQMNMQQMNTNGRVYRGDNNSQTKFSSKNCNTIKKLYKTKKYTQKEIAKKFGVTQASICRIINGRTFNSRE